MAELNLRTLNDRSIWFVAHQDAPRFLMTLPLKSPLYPFLVLPFAGKGGKNRRRGKNENEETKRELEFKEAGQEYAQVQCASGCSLRALPRGGSSAVPFSW